MARSNPEGCAGYFGWLACRAPSCPYNTTGVKVSNWWLFLCLSYFSCFVVGIAFAVAGFASMGIEMAAVGVVLVIVGACLAFLCDVMRRCGCGWTKISPQPSFSRQQIFQENLDVALSIPYLPGYPGFQGNNPGTPPPYTISQGCINSAPTFWCACRTPVTLIENPQCFEDSLNRDTLSSDALNIEREPARTENVSEVGNMELGVPLCVQHNSLNSPPPYDFETFDSQSTVSWLFDIPPPYGEIVWESTNDLFVHTECCVMLIAWSLPLSLISWRFCGCMRPFHARCGRNLAAVKLCSVLKHQSLL